MSSYSGESFLTGRHPQEGSVRGGGRSETIFPRLSMMVTSDLIRYLISLRACAVGSHAGLLYDVITVVVLVLALDKWLSPSEAW